MATKKKPFTKKATKSVGKKPVKKAAVKKPVPTKKATPKKKSIQKSGIKKAVKAVNKKPIKAVKKNTTLKSKAVTKKSSTQKIVQNKKVVKKVALKQPVINKISKKPATIQAKKPLPVKQLPPVPIVNKKVESKTPARKMPIVIPKTSVHTSVKYVPDFMKSVLDKPIQNQGDAIVRYGDAELAEFKDLIMQKLEAARKELAYLQGLITHKDEMGGDETENRYMTMEDGSVSMEREQLSQMASRQIQFIEHLENALARIGNKTYGICRVTGRLIDKARLKAVPHATLSMEAKMAGMK